MNNDPTGTIKTHLIGGLNEEGNVVPFSLQDLSSQSGNTGNSTAANQQLQLNELQEISADLASFPFQLDEDNPIALYTTPVRELASKGSFLNQLQNTDNFYQIVFEKYKNISGQYTVNVPPGGSISLEVQFSCILNGGSFSNASEDEQVITHTESGIYSFALQNFAAALIRLKIVDMIGACEVTRLDYAMNY